MGPSSLSAPRQRRVKVREKQRGGSAAIGELERRGEVCLGQLASAPSGSPLNAGQDASCDPNS